MGTRVEYCSVNTMEIKFSLEQIKSLIGDAIEVEGETDQTITGIASLTEAQVGDLSFLGNPSYKSKVDSCKASIIIVPKDYVGSPGPDQVFLRVDNPSFALAAVCASIEETLRPRPSPGIHRLAMVDSKAKVAATAYVGPFCTVELGAEVGEQVVLESHVFIGRHAKVGDNSWLMPHVTVMDRCRLGKKVRLHSGAVVGSDGFGYERIGIAHKKEPQIGIVVIEDEVEVGANTTIDRARFGETRIGYGTKIDNLVQIAHNVVIGKGCLIIAQTGISGSTTLEDSVILAGQVGVVGHLTLGKGSMVGGQTGLNHDLKPGSYVQGSPALPYMLNHRIDVLKKRMPELFKRVAKIEEFIESLKKS